jgi:hypothetical protein
VVEDVNKWSFRAHSGRIVRATSIDTHGDPTRSTRHRSHESYGFGDELRVSPVVDGVYCGAAAFLRHADRRWFSEAEVRALSTLAESIARGMRRSIVTQPAVVAPAPADHGPGVVVFDERGEPESISGSAQRWIGELVEDPPPQRPSESKCIQAVAARARLIPPGTDPLEPAARARVRIRTGTWLLMYGTRLSGSPSGRTAVIIHPATPQERRTRGRALLWPDRPRVAGGHAVHPGTRHEADRQGAVDVALHGAGPPHVHLRQDRRTYPRRTGRPDLPRPLRDPLGSPGHYTPRPPRPTINTGTP